MSLTRSAKREGRHILRLKGAWKRSLAILLFCLAARLLLLGIELAYYELFNFWGVLRQSVTLLRMEPMVLIITLTRMALCFLVLTPLHYGILGWFYALCKGEVGEVGNCFVFYTSFRYAMKSILLRLVVSLRVWVLYALLLLPIGATVYVFRLVGRGDSYGGQYLILGGCGIIICIAAAAMVVVFCQRYLLVDYLFLDNPKIGIHTAIGQSVRLMRGHCFGATGFFLSFIGWGVLSLALLPLLYTAPYVLTSTASYARERIRAQDSPVK